MECVVTAATDVDNDFSSRLSVARRRRDVRDMGNGEFSLGRGAGTLLVVVVTCGAPSRRTDAWNATRPTPQRHIVDTFHGTCNE